MVLWGSPESPPPCQGEDRGFKSRQDRLPVDPASPVPVLGLPELVEGVPDAQLGRPEPYAGTEGEECDNKVAHVIKRYPFLYQ
jgi:hypothetical protein